MSSKPKSKLKENICLCNSVEYEDIKKAIQGGCRTLNRIGDATTAGFGACGGSCRRDLEKILKSYLETSEFPENPRRQRLLQKKKKDKK